MDRDTIAAIATPPGRGGVGIVRVSGPAAPDIACALLGALPRPRYATHARFLDAAGIPLEEGIALYFRAPKSFTGEHVLELHGHGGPVVLDLVLARVLALGARHARPGEFSERAFLNDKLDLAQAEAIADLIDSASEQAARAAMRSLVGDFSECVDAVVADVADLRAYVEAAIDFPEEEVDFLAEGDLDQRTGHIIEQVDVLLAGARQGTLLREGLLVVIAGAPNAGKSSLLNRLAAREAAIVTDIPGTTRDPLREDILIDGMPVRIIDTAGLRESGDAIEVEGMRRAQAAIAEADRVLLVEDATAPMPARLIPGPPVTRIRNKIDLTGEQPGLDPGADPPLVRLSAKSGDGVEDLRAHLAALAGRRGEDGVFGARRRHLEALERAHLHLITGRTALREQRAGELLAEELRLAQEALGEITGQVTSEDLLGRIFSEFCIGK